MAKPRRSHAAAAVRADLFFHVYYAFGPDRSLAKLLDYAKQMGMDPPTFKTLGRWSAANGWQRRINEMDTRVREVQDSLAATQLAELNDRHAVLGRAMQQVGGRVYDRFLRGDANEVARNLREVGVRDAARSIEVGSKLERVARGAVTDRQELLISLWTVAVNEIAALFVNINLIDDPEVRKAEFARGVDDIVERHAAQALSAEGVG